MGISMKSKYAFCMNHLLDQVALVLGLEGPVGQEYLVSIPIHAKCFFNVLIGKKLRTC